MLITVPGRPFDPFASLGLMASFAHDQVLRNQMVGRRCNRAGSGPRLVALMRTSRSSGEAFAYSGVRDLFHQNTRKTVRTELGGQDPPDRPPRSRFRGDQ